MIVCSLKCFNFLQHGIIRMVIIGIGILGFLGPSFIEQTHQTSWRIGIESGWFQARLRMIVNKTEKLALDFVRTKFENEKINLRPNVLN